MTGGFGARLAAAVAVHGPLCVGIDPHPGLLADWGLPDDADGLDQFGRGVVDALAGRVALVKPQSAFFERHGSAGVAALERLLAHAREVGLLTVLDVKRGDIGSTMDGYARAYLADGAPLAADAITVSPYLGFGSLMPAVELAAATGRGLFVLARTSNPEGTSVQSATLDGRSVAQAVVDAAAELNAGATPLGDVGVVVGATGAHGLALGGLNGAVLAPGLGAQGATPADLAARFAGVGGMVLPAASRSVLARGPDPAALRAAVAELAAQLAMNPG
ncbi:MAG: orotidine-5'-phosphate decarboxylase [Pseudonocardia sp.]